LNALTFHGATDGCTEVLLGDMLVSSPLCPREEALVAKDLDRRFRQPLEGFFRRRGCCHASAEDLTQEAFIRLIAYRRTNAVHNIDRLIFQIAANLVRDAARSSRRQPDTRGNGVEGQLPEATDEVTPERIVQGRQEISRAMAALQELDARTQEVFLMHRMQQRRQRDIAERLGVSVSLVEKIIRHAQRHLARRATQRRMAPRAPCVPAFDVAAYF